MLPAGAELSASGELRLLTCGPGAVRFWMLLRRPRASAVAAASSSSLELVSEPLPEGCRAVFLCAASTRGFAYAGTAGGAIYQFESVGTRHHSLLRILSAHRGPVTALSVASAGAQPRPLWPAPPSDDALVAAGVVGGNGEGPGRSGAARRAAPAHAALAQIGLASAGSDGKLRLWSAAGAPLCALALGASFDSLRDSAGRPLPTPPQQVARGIGGAADGSIVLSAGRSVLLITPADRGAEGAETESAGTRLLLHVSDGRARRDEIAVVVWRGKALARAPLEIHPSQRTAGAVSRPQGLCGGVVPVEQAEAPLAASASADDAAPEAASLFGLPAGRGPQAVVRNTGLSWAAA